MRFIYWLNNKRITQSHSLLFVLQEKKWWKWMAGVIPVNHLGWYLNVVPHEVYSTSEIPGNSVEFRRLLEERQFLALACQKSKFGVIYSLLRPRLSTANPSNLQGSSRWLGCQGHSEICQFIALPGRGAISTTGMLGSYVVWACPLPLTRQEGQLTL